MSSIRKSPAARPRGQIIRRGDRKYLIRYFVRKDPSGRRQYRSQIIQGTYKQAEQALTKRLHEIDTQTFVEPSSKSLQEFLAEWLRGKSDIRKRTRLDYETRLTKDVIPHLGGTRLDRVSPQAIQGLVTTLLERGLSARTVRYTVSVLHSALEQAVRWQLLPRNPAKHLSLPKHQRREMKVLSPEQVGTLLKVTREDPLHALWMLLLTTGLRPQEALALKWGDLDGNGNRIRVQRTLVKMERDRYELRSETKTASSLRTSTLPESTLQSLREHRMKQAAFALEQGSAFARHGLIFTNAVGNPLDIARLRREWKRALLRASLPSVRLYDIRHTHITMLLSAGVNIRAVAARAGHANPNMTLSVYAHVLPEVEEHTALLLDRMVSEGRLVHSGALSGADTSKNLVVLR